MGFVELEEVLGQPTPSGIHSERCFPHQRERQGGAVSHCSGHRNCVSARNVDLIGRVEAPHQGLSTDQRTAPIGPKSRLLGPLPFWVLPKPGMARFRSISVSKPTALRVFGILVENGAGDMLASHRCDPHMDPHTPFLFGPPNPTVGSHKSAQLGPNRHQNLRLCWFSNST